MPQVIAIIIDFLTASLFLYDELIDMMNEIYSYYNWSISAIMHKLSMKNVLSCAGVWTIYIIDCLATLYLLLSIQAFSICL